MVLPEYLRSFSTDYSALQFFYSLAEGQKKTPQQGRYDYSKECWSKIEISIFNCNVRSHKEVEMSKYYLPFKVEKALSMSVLDF